MKWFWNTLKIMGTLLLIYLGLAYFGFTRVAGIKNVFEKWLGGPSEITIGCYLKEMNGCYQLKLRLNDFEQESFDKIFEGNINKSQCNLTGDLYNIEDGDSKWTAIGEIFEAEEKLEIKLKKVTRSYDDSLCIVTFHNIGPRQIESLTGIVKDPDGVEIGKAKLNKCEIAKNSKSYDDEDNSGRNELTYYVQVSCSSSDKETKDKVKMKLTAFLTENLSFYSCQNESANCTRMMIGKFATIEEAKEFRDENIFPFGNGKGVIVEYFEGNDGKSSLKTVNE